MKNFGLLVCFVMVAVGAFARGISVVDDGDGVAVAGASVFGRGGIILGMTDADGHLDGLSDEDFPVTVKCLGYETALASADQTELRLSPVSYELHEVEVTPADRPVMRLVCYIREYSGAATATDTVQLYSEHMADFFIPVAKVKKFKAQTRPRVLNSRLYARSRTRDGRDSVYRPGTREDAMSWVDMLELPVADVKESDALRAGAGSDIRQGKYWIKQRSRKTDNMYAFTVDYLADKKDHRMSPALFKLLGFTLDFNELNTSWAYRPNKEGIYTPRDLVYGTVTMSVRGRGKWVKKAFNSDTPVDINELFEIYPVETEYLTVEEAKALMRDDTAGMPMRQSPDVLPLPAATQRLVDALDSK